ncbi:hypothetical protein WA026_015384 [Henosepilachna vigintioctopunctata]|uniref:Uncharacterized protein n=1 Tax=Henosepilachna vigintioctopunctata TaxID=420089 RepID=A0AAW1UFI3_9CUCU
MRTIVGLAQKNRRMKQKTEKLKEILSKSQENIEKQDFGKSNWEKQNYVDKLETQIMESKDELMKANRNLNLNDEIDTNNGKKVETKTLENSELIIQNEIMKKTSKNTEERIVEYKKQLEELQQKYERFKEDYTKTTSAN